MSHPRHVDGFRHAVTAILPRRWCLPEKAAPCDGHPRRRPNQKTENNSLGVAGRLPGNRAVFAGQPGWPWDARSAVERGATPSVFKDASISAHQKLMCARGKAKSSTAKWRRAPSRGRDFCQIPAHPQNQQQHNQAAESSKAKHCQFEAEGGSCRGREQGWPLVKRRRRLTNGGRRLGLTGALLLRFSVCCLLCFSLCCSLCVSFCFFLGLEIGLA